MRRYAEHRAIRMSEDDVATTRLTARQAVSFRNRHQTFDSPIPRIGLHSAQDLCRFCHLAMILPVTLSSKDRIPAPNAQVNPRPCRRGEVPEAGTSGSTGCQVAPRSTVQAVISSMEDCSRCRDGASRSHRLDASKLQRILRLRWSAPFPRPES